MDGQRQPPPIPQDEKTAIAQVAQAIKAQAEEMGGIRREPNRAKEELWVRRTWTVTRRQRTDAQS